LGITTPEHIKQLGIHLGKTLNSNIKETMKQIAKAITHNSFGQDSKVNRLYIDGYESPKNEYLLTWKWGAS